MDPTAHLFRHHKGGPGQEPSGRARCARVLHRHPEARRRARRLPSRSGCRPGPAHAAASVRAQQRAHTTSSSVRRHRIRRIAAAAVVVVSGPAAVAAEWVVVVRPAVGLVQPAARQRLSASTQAAPGVPPGPSSAVAGIVPAAAAAAERESNSPDGSLSLELTSFSRTRPSDRAHRNPPLLSNTPALPPYLHPLLLPLPLSLLRSSLCRLARSCLRRRRRRPRWPSAGSAP